MSASTSDLITDVRNAARPNSARVTSGRSAGGTSLICDNLSGWPTASKVHFVTYRVDSGSNPIAGTQLDCYGIVSSNTITSFTVVDGTDTGNSIGDYVEMLPTAAWGQDLATALVASHNRDGTPLAGVTYPASTGTNWTLTTPTIASFTNATHTHANAAGGGLLGAGVVTNSNLSTVAGEVGAAWASYTPTVTLNGGTTNGNAVITGSYKQIGKTVHFWVKYVLGTTTDFTSLTSIFVSLPLPVSAGFGALANLIFGTGQAAIAGNGYLLAPGNISGNTFQLLAFNAAGTNLAAVAAAASVPAAWANTSTFQVTGTYETT